MDPLHDTMPDPSSQVSFSLLYLCRSLLNVSASCINCLRFAPWDGFDPMHPVNSSPSYGRLAASPRQVEALFSLQSVPARSQPTTLLTVATTRTCSHFHTQWQRSPGSVSGMTYRPPNVVVDCISQSSWSHAVLYLPLQPYEIWPDPETLQ